MSFIQGIDIQILNFIQEAMKSSTMDTVMQIITLLGNWGFIWIVITVLLLVSKNYKISGLKLLLALLMCTVLGSVILKPLIARPRPFTLDSSVSLLIATPSDFSFPSGHAMSAFAAATIIFFTDHKYGLFAFILAVLMAFSRLYLYVHYPSDVICGAIMGVLVALLAKYIVDCSTPNRIKRKKHYKR